MKIRVLKEFSKVSLPSAQRLQRLARKELKLAREVKDRGKGGIYTRHTRNMAEEIREKKRGIARNYGVDRYENPYVPWNEFEDKMMAHYAKKLRESLHVSREERELLKVGALKRVVRGKGTEVQLKDLDLYRKELNLPKK